MQRAQKLYGDKTLSEEEFQRRETEMAALRQFAMRQQAAIKVLQDRLARMTIKAPFSGQVVARRDENRRVARAGRYRRRPCRPLYRGLGSVVVGGLAFSTVFTLFLVPALFSLLMDLRLFITGRAAKGTEEKST